MRWLLLLLLSVALASGCDLNPQPEVPGSDEPEGAGGSAGAGEPVDPGLTDDDPGRTEAPPGPNDYSAGQGASKDANARPDAGPEREQGDAAPAPPPVVAM